jgi:hypothetical protein
MLRLLTIPNFESGGREFESDTNPPFSAAHVIQLPRGPCQIKSISRSCFRQLIAFFAPSPRCRLVSSLLHVLFYVGCRCLCLTCALSRCPQAVTAILSTFLNCIAPNHQNNLLLLTINGGLQGSFVTVLECSVHQDLTVDVSLGLLVSANGLSLLASPALNRSVT